MRQSGLMLGLLMMVSGCQGHLASSADTSGFHTLSIEDTPGQWVQVKGMSDEVAAFLDHVDSNDDAKISWPEFRAFLKGAGQEEALDQERAEHGPQWGFFKHFGTDSQQFANRTNWLPPGIAKKFEAWDH